ncbi:MAG: TM2 domain-containing protein [Eubacterium sp.]|nr:TM2 domain-containing protein [Eubacterium sp.]
MSQTDNNKKKVEPKAAGKQTGGKKTERKTSAGQKSAGRQASGKPSSGRKKSRTIAGVLAIFTGAIGLHKFYLGNWKKGIVYLLFFWTGVPAALGLLEGAHLLGSDAEPEGSKKIKKEPESALARS